MRVLLSFEEVEARLVEAMLICWRQPDRERAWLKVRAHWPEITRIDDGDHSGVHDLDRALRPASLTRLDNQRMEEALGWLSMVPAGDTRKLIGLAVTALARGDSRVPWRALLPMMGLRMGADGLAAKYRRAMGALTVRVNRLRSGGNGGFACAERVKVRNHSAPK